jgi:hypothetical protein
MRPGGKWVVKEGDGREPAFVYELPCGSELYYITFSSCNNGNAVLEWLFHLNEKEWARPTISELLDLFEKKGLRPSLDA